MYDKLHDLQFELIFRKTKWVVCERKACAHRGRTI